MENKKNDNISFPQALELIGVRTFQIVMVLFFISAFIKGVVSSALPEFFMLLNLEYLILDKTSLKPVMLFLDVFRAKEMFELVKNKENLLLLNDLINTRIGGVSSITAYDSNMWFSKNSTAWRKLLNGSLSKKYLLEFFFSEINIYRKTTKKELFSAEESKYTAKILKCFTFLRTLWRDFECPIDSQLMTSLDDPDRRMAEDPDMLSSISPFRLALNDNFI